MERLWEIFKNLGAEGLGLNHYELSNRTEEKSPDVWKKFLLLSEVSEYIEEEMSILQGSEFNKMLTDISVSKSVGQAQILNALQKLKEGSNSKDGPIIIYTYVPLSTEQEQAPNVVKLDKDIFLHRG